MRLTWRDGATTLLAVLVGLVYAAYLLSWSWPVVDGVRGATLVTGVIGLGMCILGGSGTAIPTTSAFTPLAGTLGGVAMVLVIIGLITAWPVVLAFLAADTLFLWAIATVRHAASGMSTRVPA
jgi:hypothetical protein